MTSETPENPGRRQVRLSPLGWGLLLLAFIVPGLLAGGWTGWRLFDRQAAGQDVAQLEAEIAAQYALGLEELESGEYDRAAQRFQWILIQDPNHQGAIDHLAEALVQVYVAEEQVPNPIEPAPTVTTQYDPGEAAGLLSQAENAVGASDWGAALEALAAVRQADPTYETSRVDRLLFLALRQRGVELILASDLEGGLYHLSLSERFAPLDFDARTVREWASLYLIGASFWDIFPDRAAYYFGQLAAAAPYLSDASGIPAIERYIQALIQYGDQLFQAEAWCDAAEQYGLALQQRDMADVAERAAEAAERCDNPEGTATPEITATPTLSVTTTVTPTVGLTSTATVGPTSTPTSGPTETAPPAEVTPTPEATAAPTEEITPAPTETPLPTEEPTPTPGG